MAALLPPEVGEAVFRGALRVGAWEALTARERNSLRQRWKEELSGYPPHDLLNFAAAAATQPLLVADATLHLKLVEPGPAPSDSAELDSFVAFCNVHEKLVCHGVDLKGIHLLTNLDTFRRHEVVLGISGMGKSTYMARLHCQLAVYGTPMVLLDQEKILLEEFLVHLPPERRKDVIIIDPSDMERSWGVNLVQFARRFIDETDPHYASKVEYLNDRLSSEITSALAALQLDTAGYSPGPHVREALNNLFLAAVEHESTSMMDVHALLTVPAIRDIVSPSVTRESVRNWLQYDLKAFDAAKIDGVRNKLHPFLRRVMINTFSRREACISIEQMLNENKIIVLDLDSTKLSKPISRLIGYMFLILLRITLEHRYSKAVEEGRLDTLPPCYIMVDEFRNFASTSTIDLFAEGRKRQASVIVGLQSLDQIGDDIANSLYNVSTWTVFNCGPEDATRVCKLFGLTNRLGMPRLEEITDLPKFVAKFRYEAKQRADGVQPHSFECVTLQTYPAMTNVPNGRGLLAAMREHSRRTYYKPNVEEDTRTLYDANDQTNTLVLRAIWDAHLAIRHPTEYWLGGRERLAEEGAQGRYVAQGLIQAVLEARGIQLTKQRLSQSIRYLKARRLVATEALSSGYRSTRLTPEGFRAMEAFVSPGASSNEGGEEHRKAVQRAFVALSQLGALRLSVPAQTTDQYTPDLVLEEAPANVRTRLGLPEHAGPFHFQVDVATASHPNRMASNILSALKMQAYPVLILPDAAVRFSVETALAATTKQGAEGLLSAAFRRFKRLWTGLVIDDKHAIRVLEATPPHLAASQEHGSNPPMPVGASSPDASSLYAAIGEYNAIAGGAIDVHQLRNHLVRKGISLEGVDVPDILQRVFGLHRLDNAAECFG